MARVARQRRRALLVVLMGVPGAGKTTFARALCARDSRWLHLDRDAIRARMFPQGPHDDAARLAATRRTYLLARRALHARRDVLLDGMTFATHAARRRARALARATGAACIEAHFATRLDVAKARVAASPDHPARDRDAALVERVAGGFARVKA